MDREIEILSVWNVYSSYFFSRLNVCFVIEHKAQHLSREPQMGMYLTPQTSGMSCFSVTMSLNSSALNLKPHFCGMLIFWQPGNLALSTQSLNYMFLILQLGWMDTTAWPMWTLVSLCPGASQRHHIYLSGAYQPQHRTTSSGLGWHRKGGVSLQDESHPFHNSLSCIGTNTGSLQDLRELLIWHHMVTKWKFINFCLLLPQVTDADLSIKNTSTQVKLWVRLVVLFWCWLCSWILVHRYAMAYVRELE